jgi:hypothetical protein
MEAGGMAYVLKLRLVTDLIPALRQTLDDPIFLSAHAEPTNGVVAKRRMGRYAEHGWLKIKNAKYYRIGHGQVLRSR